MLHLEAEMIGDGLMNKNVFCLYSVLFYMILTLIIYMTDVFGVS